MAFIDTVGNFLTGNAGAIGTTLGTGAQLAGQQKAGQALTEGATNAENTQRDYLGTAGGYYQPYLATGAGASTALGNALGTNGQPADYSGFENMPGYKFAVQQGTQAAERQAAAMGNAGNSGTAAMIGNQITGTAMQDYNTYIGQLQNAAGMGATAANQIGNLTYNAGANISQLQENAGQAQAGLYTGMGQTIGNALGAGNPYGSGVYGYPGSGSSGVGGGIGGLVSGGIRAIGNWLGGNSNGGPTLDGSGWNGPGSTYGGFTPNGYASGMDPNNPWANGGDTSGSLYVPGADQGGNAGYVDQSGGDMWSVQPPP